MKNPYEWRGKLYEYIDVNGDEKLLKFCEDCDLNIPCTVQRVGDGFDPKCTNVEDRVFYIMKEIKYGDA